MGEGKVGVRGGGRQEGEGGSKQVVTAELLNIWSNQKLAPIHVSLPQFRAFSKDAEHTLV